MCIKWCFLYKQATTISQHWNINIVGYFCVFNHRIITQLHYYPVHTHKATRYWFWNVAFYPVDIKKGSHGCLRKADIHRLLTETSSISLWITFNPSILKLHCSLCTENVISMCLYDDALNFQLVSQFEKNVFIFFVLFFTTFNRLYCFIWLNKSMLNVMHQFEIFELMTKRVRVALR